MAVNAVLNGAETARLREPAAGWSPLMKLTCFVGCAVVVLAPFFLIG